MLSDSQRLFWRLISAPESVRQLPADEQRAAAAMVRGDDRMSAVERVDVYANMYFFRLLGVLQEDFPALNGLVGEVAFHNLITAYLLEHPSTHFSLREVGRHLPEFVARQPIARQFPSAALLARFEWEMFDVFDGEDESVLDPVALAAVAPDAWGDLKLQLSASLRLFRCDWPIPEIWRAAKDEQACDLEARLCFARVWRQDMRVWNREISQSEHEALSAFRDGASFGQVCENLAAGGDEEHAAEQAVTLLRAWLADGLLTGLR